MKKVQTNLVSPAINSMMHMAAGPIISAIQSPLDGAMEELEEHKAEQLVKLQNDIEHGSGASPAILKARQKRVLEEALGILVDASALQDADLHTPVGNSNNMTVSELQQQVHGDIKVMYKDGQLHAVLPTYKGLCDNIAIGGLPQSGEMQMQMAQRLSGKPTTRLTHTGESNHDAVHSALELHGGDAPTSSSWLVAHTQKGANGELGHLAPIIRGADGQYQVVELPQDHRTKNACFAQTEIFHREFERTGDLDHAKKMASLPSEVDKYHKKLGKAMKSDGGTRKRYEKGATLQAGYDVVGVKPIKPSVRERDSYVFSLHQDHVNAYSFHKTTPRSLYDNPETRELYSEKIHVKSAWTKMVSL